MEKDVFELGSWKKIEYLEEKGKKQSLKLYLELELQVLLAYFLECCHWLNIYYILKSYARAKCNTRANNKYSNYYTFWGMYMC